MSIILRRACQKKKISSVQRMWEPYSMSTTTPPPQSARSRSSRWLTTHTAHTTHTTPIPTTTTARHNTKKHRPQPNPNDKKVMVSNMRERFLTNDDSNNKADVWESLWKDGMTPWDLGGPTKVLLSELNDKLESSSWLPRNTMMSLIPGCGSGHDVVSLARYLDARTTTKDSDESCMTTTTTTPTPTVVVVGLEVSTTSLEKARQRIEDSLEKEGPFLRNRTTIRLYQGDFFHSPSQWKAVYTTDRTTSSISTTAAPPVSSSSAHQDKVVSSTDTLMFSDDQTFDFVFDYTFFCAIPPKLRPQWGEQMGKLIASPDGKLLTLMFPYHDDDDDDDDWAAKKPNESVSSLPQHERTAAAPPQKGPPYLVSVKAYQNVLERRGHADTLHQHMDCRVTTRTGIRWMVGQINEEQQQQEQQQ